jgi:uncharacterized repeat protein (TIGR03803 family)
MPLRDPRLGLTKESNMTTRSRFAIALGAVGFLAGMGATSPGTAYTETILHQICSSASCSDGDVPNAPVIQDSNGKLYGTTTAGGAHGGGVVFRYNPSSGNYTVLYNFCSTTSGTLCTDGNFPETGLIMDTSGNLYGTTFFGGANGGGSVFELKKPMGGGGWTLQTLYSFCPVVGCADGESPNSKLTYAGAASGSLYDGTSLLFGTTRGGSGVLSSGVVYALQNSSGTWSEKVIHTFCSSCTTDGQEPSGTLFMDSASNLWGATRVGGSASDGIAYKLTHGMNQWSDPWTQTILYNFCWAGTPCTDGENPNGLFVKTGPSSTTVYGTASAGGANGGGTIFKLTNGSCTEGGVATFWCETVLYDFCGVSFCTDGGDPTPGGDVFLDSSGDIFGTTKLGGSSSFPGGTVFELSGATESVLYAFCQTGGSSCTDGKSPNGVIMDSSGNFYGTTSDGGTGDSGSGEGVLFELTP